jgi:hypothetical protein
MPEQFTSRGDAWLQKNSAHKCVEYRPDARHPAMGGVL